MNTSYPIRKPMNHKTPFVIHSSSVYYFITICAKERGTTQLLDKADKIMEAARFYHTQGYWFLSLFLIMPDHLHMLIHIPPDKSLSQLIGQWKHYLSREVQIEFQEDFFDTRIRDDEHYREKWNYILQNPVARGLVKVADEWKYVIRNDRVG